MNKIFTSLWYGELEVWVLRMEKAHLVDFWGLNPKYEWFFNFKPFNETTVSTEPLIHLLLHYSVVKVTLSGHAMSF